MQQFLPDAGDSDQLYLARLAHRYRASLRHKGQDTCWWWHNSFWQWSAKCPCYQRVSFDDMTYRVLQYLIQMKITARPGTAVSVAHCLAAKSTLDTTVTQPSWIGGVETRHCWYLSLQNQLVDPLAVARGQLKAYHKHTPQWFSPTLLPYAYDSSAECPRWLAWLQTMLDGDEQRISLLQEFFGYWLTPDNSRQCTMFLYGEGGTGKSTLLHVLKNLIGVPNCSFLSLTELTARFGLGTTEGKLLNISDEGGTFPKTAESTFKWLVGGTEMSFERKHVDAVTCRPTVRLVIALNPPWPNFSDQTNAMYRRMRVLPMLHKIPEDAYDYSLQTTLLTEISGIFNWAVTGLARLGNGRFTSCAAGERVLGECRQRNQPHLEFIADRVRAKPGGFITAQTLHAAYAEWREEQGVPGEKPSDALVDAVCRAVPGCQRGRKRGGPLRQRGVQNVELHR